MSRAVIAPVVSCAIIGLISAVAAGQAPVGVVYTTWPGLASTQVPGSSAIFTVIQEVRGSPNGSHWLLQAEAEFDAEPAEILMAGSGATGEVAFRPGVMQLPLAGTSARLTRDMAVNDAGEIALKAYQPAEPVGSRDYVFRRSQAGWDVVAEGFSLQPQTNPYNVPPVLREVTIDADGTVGYVVHDTDAPPGSGDAGLLVHGLTIDLVGGVSVPAQQLGSTSWPVGDLRHAADHFRSADGQHYALRSHLRTDEAYIPAVIVDGRVVLQQGQPLAELGASITSLQFAYMDAAGNWFAAGSTDDRRSWFIRNGDLLAVSGGLIGDTDRRYGGFTAMAANASGDFVVLTRGLFVLNNETIVLEGGDAVDFDGNGLYDDGIVYQGTTGTNGLVLSDDLRFYLQAQLLDEGGASRGQALLVAQIPEPATAVLLAFGLIGLRRRP